MNSIVTQDDLERVISEYSNTVYRLAFVYMKAKSETDDVYQEVFLRLIRKPHSFISKKEEKDWIIQTTIYCCKRRKPIKQIKPPTLWEDSDVQEEVALTVEDEGLLEQVLSKLSLKHLLVAHLFYEEGYSVEELAKLLNKKPSRIRSYLLKSKSILQEISPIKVVHYV